MAWSHDVTVPAVNGSTYTEANASSRVITVSYSSQSSMQVPVPMVFPGETLRIRTLAPPGVSSIAIRAESNTWQNGAVMNSYDSDPGVFRESTRSSGSPGDGNVYINDLHAAGGGLNEYLYGNGSPAFAALTEPRYTSFVLYNPPTGVNFTLVSLHITFLIGNVDAYTAWRNARSWNGGSGNADGIGETAATATSTAATAPRATEAPKTEVSTGNAMMMGHPSRTGTGTSINLSGTVDGVPQAANSTVRSGGFLQTKLAVTPDAEDNGKQVSVIVLAAWEDQDSHNGLLNAVWQQYSGNVWQAWVGPRVEGKNYFIENVSPHIAQVPLSAGQFDLPFGPLSPPGGVSANGRKVSLFVGYQVNGNPSYSVVSQPLVYRVS